MADKILFEFDLDTKEFKKALGETMEAMAHAGTHGESKFAAVGEQVFHIIKGTAILGVALKALEMKFESALEADKAIALNKQFEILADNAGLAAESFKTALFESTGGGLTREKALELANKSLVELGANASKIPDIMEMARKASVITGQSLEQSFSTISEAIGASSTRMLKQYGIVVDNESAILKYARATGKSVQSLSELEKKQAVANEIIEKGQKVLKNVDPESAGLNNAYEAFKNSLSDLSHLFTELIGESTLLKNVFITLSGAVSDFSNAVRIAFGHGEEKASAQRMQLEKTIETYERLIAEVESDKGEGFFDRIFGKEKTLEINQSRLEMLRKDLAKYKSELDDLEGPEEDTEAVEIAVKKETEIERDKRLAMETKTQLELNSIRQRNLELRSQMNTDELAVENLASDRRVLVENEIALKKAQLQAQGALDNRNVQQEMLALEEERKLRIQQIEQDILNAKIEANRRWMEDSQSTADGIARGFAGSSRAAALELRKGTQLGVAAFNALGNNATNAFLQMGSGAATAGEAMRGFFFGAIADTAQAFGQQMLLASIWPPNPAGLAAGAGLIALAGYLRSQAQGKQAFAGGGAGGLTGGVSEGGVGQALPGVDMKEKEKKMVSINVEGNYFETDQTRTRLMEIIRESSDFTDFTLKQIGQ